MKDNPPTDEALDALLDALVPVDLHALMSGDPPVTEYLIEPLLIKGRATGVVSKRGDGKSLFSLDAATALAVGAPFLNGAAGKPVRVLYLDMEMVEEDLYNRLADLGFTPDHPDWDLLTANLIYFQLVLLPPLNTEFGGRAFEALCERSDAEVVVIDTLSRVVVGRENDAEPYQDLYRFTESRLKARGITLLRLDHFGKDKSRDSRGSSAKEDGLDVVWGLSVAGDVLTFKNLKSRQAGTPRTLTVYRESDDGYLKHRTHPTAAPQKVRDIAEDLDDLGMPVDATVLEAVNALRAAGRGKRRTDVIEAVRYRKTGAGTFSGTVREPFGEPSGTPVGEATAARETERNRLGNPAGQGRGRVHSLEREPPDPDQETIKVSTEVADAIWGILAEMEGLRAKT